MQQTHTEKLYNDISHLAASVFPHMWSIESGKDPFGFDLAQSRNGIGEVVATRDGLLEAWGEALDHDKPLRRGGKWTVLADYGDDCKETEFKTSRDAAEFFITEHLRMRVKFVSMDVKPTQKIALAYPKLNTKAHPAYSSQDRKFGLKLMLDDPRATDREKFLAQAILTTL